MTTPVLINREGGTARARGQALEGELRAAFDQAGAAIELQLLTGSQIEGMAHELRDEPLVVVGGGDGTLGAAAGALAGGKAALGILPVGTRNHLARALAIPLDLPGAAVLIAARTLRRIDLARVNDRAFVNNAAVGFYPDLVRERDASNLPKLLATVPATFAVLKRLRHHRLCLSMPNGEQHVATPLLFVGNNRYSLDVGHLGERAALDDGILSVFAIAAQRRRQLVGFALRTLIGRANPERDFAAIGDTSELTVTGHARDVAVALDGEVQRMTFPLRFVVEAGALTVVAAAVAPLEAKPATA